MVVARLFRITPTPYCGRHGQLFFTPVNRAIACRLPTKAPDRTGRTTLRLGIFSVLSLFSI